MTWMSLPICSTCNVKLKGPPTEAPVGLDPVDDECRCFLCNGPAGLRVPRTMLRAHISYRFWVAPKAKPED